jgi:prevent-host-death family protein
MRSVSVSEAKNNLSAILREIRGGATILITDRGVPVARLAPPVSARGISASAIELAQRGRLVLPERQPTAKWLDLPRAKTRGKASALRALLDEREEAR